ncbi:ABC transporter permease [Acidisoma silvae]|uniref:ABC transporter permease n=1 Tax=Acidisoma silvae TaxID=2802396 RepID=A0A963YXK3_9PROT|nr:ABC transporter permease [Acidisoma silvae]MCB8878003.1 ABC transporter permease [Acidisoma silvae]
MSRSFVQAALAPVILLILWEAASHSGLVDPRFLPPLEQVWIAGRAEWASGDLAAAIRASLARDILGFIVGSTIGTVLGVVIGLSKTTQRLLGPMLVVHRQIALFAWIPLLSAWFGGGEVGKIAFIAMAAFQPTVVNSWRGVANIPQQYRELSMALAFRGLDFLTLIALPGSLAEIFAGLRAALIYAWMATIGAELLLDVAPGLGGRMDEGQHLFEMNLLVFYLIVLAIVGGLFTLATGRLETRLARWRAA